MTLHQRTPQSQQSNRVTCKNKIDSYSYIVALIGLNAHKERIIGRVQSKALHLGATSAEDSPEY